MATIAVLGTLDTKGHEHAFVAERIRGRGHDVLLIDAGTGGPPQVPPDVRREEILPDGFSRPDDRGSCVVEMSEAVPDFVQKMAEAGRFDAIISLGGGGGTAIGTAAMRALPLGFPKLMVSTLASGNTAHYVGTKDIVMFPAVVDVAGLNGVSRTVFTRAAGAVCGMVEAKIDNSSAKPVIVASMFGNTTDCVNTAKEILENAGYEVLVFHATGAGGRAMESLIESGMVKGVLDITTTELADELVGGTLSAGPERMDATAKAGIPAVVVPGCVDMVNFGERDSVPEKFEGRNFYIHNPQVTLMRTNAEENAALGKILADKVNACTAGTAVLLPAKAVSIISAEGGAFYDPAADAALFQAIRENLRHDVPVTEMDCRINDPEFAKACAEALLAML